MMFACVVFLAAVVSLQAAPEHMGEATLAKGHASNNSTVYNGNADVTYEGIGGNMEEAAPEQNGTKTKEQFSIYDKFRRFIQNFNKIITRLPIGTKENVQNKLRDILLKYKRTEITGFAAKNDDLIEKEINITKKDIDLLNNSNLTINENGTESLQLDIKGKTDAGSISYLINVLSSENLDEKSRQFLNDLLDSSYLPANATDAVSPSLPPVHPSLFEFATHGVKREKIKKDKDEEEEEDESEEKGDENNDKNQKKYEDEKSNLINLSFPVEALSDMILFEDESPKKLSTEQNIIPISQMTSSVTWNHPSSKVINLDKNKPQLSYPLDHPSLNIETLDVLTQLTDILTNQEKEIRPEGKGRSEELNSDTLFELVPLSKLLTEPISNAVGKASVDRVPGSKPGVQISSTGTWEPTIPDKATPVKKQESDNVFLAGLPQTFENMDVLSQLTDILGDPKKYVEITEKIDEDSQEINDDPISEKFLISNFPVNPTLSTKHFEDHETKPLKQPQNLPELHTKSMESSSELKSLDTFLAGTLQRTQSLDAASHFKNVQDPGKEIKALENLLRLAEGFSPEDENKKSVSFQQQNNLFGNDNLFMQLLQDDDANKNTADKGESESKEDVEPERFVGNENTNRFLLGSTGSGNDDTLPHVSSTHLISALFPAEQQMQVNVIRFNGNHEEQIEKRNEENRKPKENQSFLLNSDIKKGEFSKESEEDTNNGLSILSIIERERQLAAGNQNNKLKFDDENEESGSSEVQDTNGKRNLSGGDTESASKEIKNPMGLSMDEKSYIDAENNEKSKSSEEVGSKDNSDVKNSNSDPFRNLQSSRESSLGNIDQDSFELGVGGQDLSISAEQKSSNSVSSEKSNSVGSEKQSSNSVSTEKSSSKSGSNEQGSSNSGSSEQDSSNSGSSKQDSSHSRSSEQDSSDSDSSSKQDSSNSDSSEQDSSNSGSSKQDSSNSGSSEQDSSNSDSSSKQDSSNSDSSSKQDSSNSDSSEQDSSNSGSSEQDSSNSDSSGEDSRSESSENSDNRSSRSESSSSSEETNRNLSNSEDSEEGTRPVHGLLKLFDSESSSSEDEQERPTNVIPRDDRPPILPQQPNPPPYLPIDDIIPPLIRPKNDEKFVPNLPDKKRNDGKIPRDEEIIRNVNTRWNFDEGWDDYLNIFKPIENDDDLFIAVQNIDISLPKEREDDTSYKKTYSEEKKTGYGYRSLKNLISEYYNDRKNGQRRYSSYLDDSYKRKRMYGNDVGYIQPTKYKRHSTYSPEDPYKYTTDINYKGDIGYIKPTQYSRYFPYPDDSYGYRTEQKNVEYIQPIKHTRHSAYSNNMYSNNAMHRYRDSPRHPRHMHEDSRKHPRHMYENFRKHPRHMYADSSEHSNHDNAKYTKNTFNGQKILKLSSSELNELNQLYRESEHYRPHPFDAPLNRIPSPTYPGRHPTMHDPFQDYRRNGGRTMFPRGLISTGLSDRRLPNTRLPGHKGLISTGLSDRRLPNTRLAGHRGLRYSPDRSFRRQIFAEPTSLRLGDNRDFFYPNIHTHRQR